MQNLSIGVVKFDFDFDDDDDENLLEELKSVTTNKVWAAGWASADDCYEPKWSSSSSASASASLSS